MTFKMSSLVMSNCLRSGKVRDLLTNTLNMGEFTQMLSVSKLLSN